jgi:iron complex transport system substrate-binding protein
MKRVLLFFILLCIVITAPSGTAASVPRLIGGHFSVSWLIYAVAPDSLIAWNNMTTGRALEFEKLFVRKDMLTKEAVGSRTMGGMNPESLLLLKPTAVVLADFVTTDIMSDSLAKKAGIEISQIKFERFEDYADSIREIGRLAQAQTRAAHLTEFVQSMLADLHKRVGSIPESKRLKVFYASSPSGLETATGNTVHDHVITYAGGRNAFPAGSALNKVRFKVTFEQILEYDPDVVIINDRAFAEKNIKTLPGWQTLRAVKAGRVYVVPDAPVSWLDQPVSMFQLAGAWWLAAKLYPEQFPEGYRPMIERFFDEFLQVKMDAQRWKAIESGTL